MFVQVTCFQERLEVLLVERSWTGRGVHAEVGADALGSSQDLDTSWSGKRLAQSLEV